MTKKAQKKQPGLSWAALKDEWRAWLTSKAPVLAFAAKFGGLVLILYCLLALPFSEKVLYSYLEVNASASHFILNLLGQDTSVSEVTIRSTSASFAIAIRRGCDAIEPTGLLCAAILAAPGLVARKLVGMVAGAIILQALNLVRIVTLFLVGNHFPRGLFDSVHLEIWPALFILVAVACFVGWKGWAFEE